MEENYGISKKRDQKVTEQRSAEGNNANHPREKAEKVNAGQKHVNQNVAASEIAPRKAALQGCVPQKNVLQGAGFQKNASSKITFQENTAPAGNCSKSMDGRALLQKRIARKREQKKEQNGLQHSDDEEKLKIIEELDGIIKDNGFDEHFLEEHSNCSKSSIRRLLAAWMDRGGSMSNWTTIFNMTTCLSANSVFIEHLFILLVTVVIYLIGNSGVVRWRILSPSKAVIEINFSKNKSLYKKAEKNKEEEPENSDEKSGDENMKGRN